MQIRVFSFPSSLKHQSQGLNPNLTPQAYGWGNCDIQYIHSAGEIRVRIVGRVSKLLKGTICRTPLDFFLANVWFHGHFPATKQEGVALCWQGCFLPWLVVRHPGPTWNASMRLGLRWTSSMSGGHFWPFLWMQKNGFV